MRRLRMIWKAVEMYKRKGLYYVGELVVHDGKCHYEYRFIKGDKL